MKKQLIIAIVLVMMVTTACKTSEKVVPTTLNTKATSDIAVPAGFLWQTSRNESFTVNVTDNLFQNVKYLVAIYDADPAAGGKILIKGAASSTVPFVSTVYIPSVITQVYVVKTSPDNTSVTQSLKLTTTVATVTI